MSEGWAQNLANELHQPIRRRFPKRRVISYGIDNIWAADLVEMGKFSKWNKGISSMIKRVLGQPNFSPQTNTTQLSPKLTQTLTTYHPLKLTQTYKLC